MPNRKPIRIEATSDTEWPARNYAITIDHIRVDCNWEADTQQEAIEAARDWIKSLEGREVIVDG